MQYLAIFFVINYFVRQVEGFIYNNRVLQSTVTGAQEVPTAPSSLLLVLEPDSNSNVGPPGPVLWPGLASG